MTSSSNFTVYLVDRKDRKHMKKILFNNHKAARNYCKARLKEDKDYTRGVVVEPNGKKTAYVLE